MKQLRVSRWLCSMLIFVLTACGGNTTPTASPATPEATSASAYRTKVFRAPFTVELPPGWYVAERDSDGIQIFQPCKTCPHDGEEHGEITLDMALAKSSPSDAIARLQTGKNITPGPSEPVKLGDLSGFKFTATRTGKPDVVPVFQDSGYRTEAGGAPLEVYVVTAAGKTVTIIIDPHESTGDAARTFAETALTIIQTIHFSD